MMKHIIFILAFAVSICSTAQVTYQFSTTSQEELDKFLKEINIGKQFGQTAEDASATTGKYANLLKAFAAIPADYLTGSGSEQGQDRLDSLYYLNTKMYELPYASKKDKKFADDLMKLFVKFYDQDLPLCKGGYCYTGSLESDANAESKQLEMFYAEGLKPFVAGGKGRNYVILRDNVANSPYYRTVIGAEWWLNTNSKKTTLSLQTFKLRGALTYELYLKAQQESAQAKHGNNWGKKDEASAEVIIQTSTEGFLSTKEGLLQAIATFAKFYNEKNDALDRAVIKAINERIVTYLLFPDMDSEDYTKLFHVLAPIPGYEVKVTFADGEIISQSDFGSFENLYNKLDILCTTWSLRGDPECVKPVDHFGWQEKKPINFLYQVVVNNDKGVKVGK